MAKRTLRDRLLPGEKLTIPVPTEEAKHLSDNQIDAKYVAGDVRIITETARYPLDSIDNMLKSTDYALNPEYQRRHRWDTTKKSRLIESFIMNVPVPPIFLYEVDYAKYEVMDGRQRLTAISEFYKCQFALKGLEYWQELEGRTYSTLPGKVKSGIDRRYLSSIILLKETAKNEEEAKQLKQIVFERLNSGGVKLQPQETRNAIYDGPLNKLCKDLATNEVFRRLWGIPDELLPQEIESELDDEGFLDDVPNKGKAMFEKMDDVELVLRFFAYRQIEEWPGGSLNRLGAFLDQFLRLGNKFSEEMLSQYRSIFIDTVTLIDDVLGSHAFCRWNGKTWEKTPNKIIYDPMMYAFSRYAGTSLAPELISRKEYVEAAIRALHEDPDTPFKGRKTNRTQMIKRNELMDAALAAVVGKPRARSRRS